jgi:hypothetical protein
MDERDLIREAKVTRPREEFIHKTNDDKECGKIRKVIDDNGDIYYECIGCGKRWITGEKATLRTP